MRISDWSSDVCSSDLLGLGLGAVEHLELTRREGPRVGPSLTEAEVLLLHRSDDLFEEADHSLVQRLSPLAHAQVEQLRSLFAGLPHVVLFSCVAMCCECDARVSPRPPANRAQPIGPARSNPAHRPP